MKAKTRELLAEIEAAHDWSVGQPRAGNGTQLSQTDECRICSLRRHWFSDTQNHNTGDYTFSDGETDQAVSIRQVMTRGCAGETKPCEGCAHLERLLVILTEARDANAQALKLAGQALETATLRLVANQNAVRDLLDARENRDPLAEQSAIERLKQWALLAGPQQ